MKPVKIIYYLGLGIIALLAVLLIFSTFPIPGNYKLFVVQSGSMQPGIKLGSIVVVKPTSEYQKGDIISFNNVENPKNIITHRIFEVKEEKGITSYITKGDANEEPDERAILGRDVIGKVLFSVPLVGFGVAATRQPLGFMLLIIFPAALIIYDEIRKIKDEVVKMRSKKALFFLLAFSVTLMTFNFTRAYLADTETSAGNAFQVTTWGVWKQTEKGDFEAGGVGKLINVDTTTSPDDVMLTGAYPVEGDTVALWHLNEGIGSTAYDETGNDNDGTLNGDTKWVTGRYSQALEFDGDGDYIDCGNDASLNIAQGSWELWLKFATKPSDAGHLMNPLAKQEQYWIHASSDDSIQAKISVGGTRYIATTGADFIEIGEWYHVAGTYDGETLNLYVNGELKDSNTDPSGNLDTTNNILAIGTWSSLIDYFNGTIDEVGISSSVKTSFPVNYFPSGTLESQVFNGGGPRDWDYLEWDETLTGDPGDNDITFEVATSTNGSDWSAWSAPLSDSPIDLTGFPPTQYIKWRATLTTTDNTKTPKLKEVRVRHFSP